MSLQSTESQKKIRIDAIDKKILVNIMQDARVPYNILAKKLNISQQRLQYKIQRLEQELLNPGMIINFPKLNIPSYVILTQNIENIDLLLKCGSLFLFMQAIGRYKYIMIVVTDNLQKFLLSYLQDVRVEIHPVIAYHPDDFNPFNLVIPTIVKPQTQNISLDDKDKKIIKQLCIKPLESYLQLSVALKIDRQTIKERIANLYDQDIIMRFRYGINVFKLGLILYAIKIETTSTMKKKILSYLHSDGYSGFVFETYNGFIMYYLPPSHNELFKFTKGIEKIDSSVHVDVIQNTEFFTVDTTPKNAINVLVK